MTGACGYTGRDIASRLLDRGHTVRSLTNSPDRKNAFDGKVLASRFHFDDLPRLVEALRDAAVLYNTYWVRFNHTDFQHSVAVENTLKLFSAAEQGESDENVVIGAIGPETFTYRELVQKIGQIIGKRRPVCSVPP